MRIKAVSLTLLLAMPAAFASGSGGEAKKAEAPALKEEHHEAPPEVPMAEKPALQSSRDVKIPKALTARLEKDYRAYLEKQQIVLKDGIKRRLLNVTAEFTQTRAAALHEDTRVKTPLGGGIVDMAQIVTPLRGAFHLRLIPSRDNHAELPPIRVFYVSGARERVIGGETFGAGCDKFMEITSMFNKKMSHKGFELFSAEQRYASVVGGTFVIVAFDIETLGVASISFTDSRYPDLFCEG